MASISDAVNKEVYSLEREADITKQKSKRKQDCVLPLLDFPLEGEYILSPAVKNVIAEQWEALTIELDRYILEYATKYSWMCHSFVTDVEDLADNISNITGIKGQSI
jgi:hypothetical protein